MASWTTRLKTRTWTIIRNSEKSFHHGWYHRHHKAVQILHIWGRQILNYETIYDPLLHEYEHTLGTSKFMLLFHLTPADFPWDHIEWIRQQGNSWRCCVCSAANRSRCNYAHLHMHLLQQGTSTLKEAGRKRNTGHSSSTVQLRRVLKWGVTWTAVIITLTRIF